MPKNNFVTELVNAFNLCNYYFDDVNTNFTVKGNKIVGLFASDVEVKKYFQEVKKEIIKQHYGTEEAAGEYYNLNYFPFVFDVNSKWKAKERAIREVELADSTNNEVIRNLKIYFAKEFQRVVEAKVIKNLETSARMTKKKACECLEGSVLEEIDRYSPYLYCISFNDRYCEENRYPPRFFKAFRGMYISAFDFKLEEYGFNDSSIFYEQRDNKLYIKDITNIDVIKNVAKHVREQIALDFKTPGKEDSKVENLKDVLRDLIFKKVGKPINAYDYDVFIDKKQRKDGHSFALIPLEERRDGEFYSLGLIDAIKIDPNVLNLFKNSNISNVMGKVANPQFANCKEPVYAFSNKHIARLLPIIMESPIAYNERNGCFEFAVDLENFKRRSSSRSSSTVTSPFNSPTHEEPPKTPPEQTGARFKGDRDSGIGESPPKPEDSGSSSGGPGSFLEQSQAQRFPTRNQDVAKDSLKQGSEKKQVLHNPVNLAGTGGRCSPSSQVNSIAVNGVIEPKKCVGAAANVPASTNLWTQQPNPLSLPFSSDISVPQKQNKIQQFFRNLSIRRSKSNGKTTKDILQCDKETFSSFSSGMQRVLSLPLSLDMIRNLFPHFPIGKREKLILLARSEKVKKSHSSPEEIEQLLSPLLPEEEEICSLLFFPDRKNETYVDLSPGAKEQVVLFWEVLRGRGFNSTSSEESGIFSGSSSQGSTSDDKDELEASGRSSVSSNSSTSTVRTKVDSLKLEQCSSKGIGGWI